MGVEFKALLQCYVEG